MKVVPGKAEILRESLDREIPRWPLGRFQDDIKIEINCVYWIKDRFEFRFSANMRIFLAEHPVNRAFIFRVIVDHARLGSCDVANGVCEGSFLSLVCRVFRKERYESLRGIITAAAFDEAVQVADIPHRIDFNVEEQLARGGGNDHWRAQIRFSTSSQKLRPRMEFGNGCWADTREYRLLTIDKIRGVGIR